MVFQDFKLVFEYSRSVFMVFQGFRLVFHGFKWVFMVFQGSSLFFMVSCQFFYIAFQGSWLVFHGSRWVFIVPGRFSMVLGGFFMVPARPSDSDSDDEMWQSWL